MNKKEGQGRQGDSGPDVFNDGLFTIKISDDMALRNALRAGLVEAQGKDTDKIPMFVSWPPWLEDGVVCLFAKDLHAVLRNVMRDMAESAQKELGVDIKTADLGVTPLTNVQPVEAVRAVEPADQAEAEVPGETEPAIEASPVQESDGTVEESVEAEPESSLNGNQALADKLFNELRSEMKK